MSQIAIIEIDNGIIDLTKIKNKSFDKKIYFDTKYKKEYSIIKYAIFLFYA